MWLHHSLGAVNRADYDTACYDFKKKVCKWLKNMLSGYCTWPWWKVLWIVISSKKDRTQNHWNTWSTESDKWLEMDKPQCWEMWIAIILKPRKAEWKLLLCYENEDKSSKGSAMCDDWKATGGQKDMLYFCTCPYCSQDSVSTSTTYRSTYEL
jgi:hypothetical protein